MKKVKRIISAVLAAVSAVSLCGCVGGGNVSADEKTLNIRVYKSGYGDAYVYNWIYEFENAFKEEGYRVNVVDSTEGLQGTTVTNEMILGSKNTTDLYIAGNVSPRNLKVASDNEEMDMIAANLDDVYDSYPIKADGSEESVKIKDKLTEGFAQYFMLDGSFYTFAFRTSPVLLTINPDVYPANREYPRTTDELISVCDDIRSNGNIYPFAYGGRNAASYLYGMEDVWVAQYSGTGYYADFLSMSSEDSATAYDLYKNEGWIESLDVIARIQQGATKEKRNFDGGISSSANNAQDALLRGKAAMMCVGQQLQNEMFVNYAAQTKKMTAIKVPVISAITKLCDSIENDEELSALVKAIDNGETAISGEGYNVTEEDFARVKAARNVVYDWGAPHSIILNSYSQKLDIAKKFLRYIASDDAAKTAYAASTTMSCYTKGAKVDYTSMHEDSNYLKSVISATEGDITTIYRFALGKRSEYSIPFFTGSRASLENELYANKTLTASAIMSEEYEAVKKSWERIYKG